MDFTHKSSDLTTDQDTCRPNGALPIAINLVQPIGLIRVTLVTLTKYSCNRFSRVSLTKHGRKTVTISLEFLQIFRNGYI